MARHVSTALAVLAATLVSLAFGSVGQAQDLVITVNSVQDRDAERPALTSPYLFSAADCAGGKTVTLTITNFPVTPIPPPMFLDFWRGTNCNDATVRANTTSPTCWHLTSESGVVGPMIQTTGITVEDLGGCTLPTAADGTAVAVYVLAATGDNTLEAVTSYGVINTTFDIVPPAAPTNVAAGVGNTAVPVSWTLSPGTVGGSYRVYMGSATTSSEGGTCGGDLVAGALPPATARLVATVGGTVNSAELDLAALGLAIGESASVGVVARDAAFNDGVLSNVTCVTRVETCGYICQRGSPLATCSCSLPGARGAGGAAVVGLLTAALALLVVRMRGDRSAR